MKDVMSAKGLSDLRTAITTRLHAKPPQKGTTHLDLYLLSKEKERLEKEQARLEQQQKRKQEHLAEVCQTIEKLQREAQLENSTQGSSTVGTAREQQSARPAQYSQRRWKKMTLDY